MIGYLIFSTVLGPVTVSASPEGITGLQFGECPPKNAERGGNPLLELCREQLEEYLAGERKGFNLPLVPEGTEFQRKVWQALGEIPYGRTCSYSELARRIGSPKACRAVGMANHRNPIAILIPCHRVVGKNGRLVGYAGGLERKAYLLDLEKN